MSGVGPASAASVRQPASMESPCERTSGITVDSTTIEEYGAPLAPLVQHQYIPHNNSTNTYSPLSSPQLDTGGSIREHVRTPH